MLRCSSVFSRNCAKLLIYMELADVARTVTAEGVEFEFDKQRNCQLFAHKVIHKSGWV